MVLKPTDEIFCGSDIDNIGRGLEFVKPFGARLKPAVPLGGQVLGHDDI